MFSSERGLVEHTEACLKINGKQTVKLSYLIKFRNHFKQLALSIKIYADFESVLKGDKGSDRNNNSSYTEKYQKHITCNFGNKAVCIDKKFSKPVALYRGRNVYWSNS